jgi:hypothetical protein
MLLPASPLGGGSPLQHPEIEGAHLGKPGSGGFALTKVIKVDQSRYVMYRLLVAVTATLLLTLVVQANAAQEQDRQQLPQRQQQGISQLPTGPQQKQQERPLSPAQQLEMQRQFQRGQVQSPQRQIQQQQQQQHQ